MKVSQAFAQLDWRFQGAVAQLVEHLLCKQEVVGSIPIRSTIPWPGSREVSRTPGMAVERREFGPWVPGLLEVDIRWTRVVAPLVGVFEG